MHTYLSSVLGDLLPGLVAVVIGVVAALPPYHALRRTGRGRARSSIGYLMGFAAGLAGTISILTILHLEGGHDAVALAGLMGAFFGPFYGMFRAKRQRKQRPRRRIAVEGLST